MSQEINLYEERLRPHREILTGHHLGVLALVVLALAALLAAWTQYDAARASAAAASLKAQVSQLQTQIAELNKAISGRRVSPPLAASLEQAREALEMRQAALELLDSGHLGSAGGFSEIFTGFSHQALANPNLWLVGFSVTQGGKAIEIRGRTLDASALPAYVQRLGKEDAFRGRRFSGLEMLDHESGKQAATSNQTATPQHFTEFTLHSEGAPNKTPGGRS
jgi:cell division protein FtsB